MSGRPDAATIAERLLSISGDDGITVDRKNLAPVHVTLPTRFMVLTNELPKLADPSGAVASRFIILRLTRSWFGTEDHGLTDRLLAELPGILLWAIAGWQRLPAHGRFVQPDSARELVNELEDLASPIAAFIRDRCDLGPSLTVDKDMLFHAWRSWCEADGRQHAGDKPTFGRNLRAAEPTVGAARPRIGAARSNVYAGIALK